MNLKIAIIDDNENDYKNLLNSLNQIQQEIDGLKLDIIYFSRGINFLEPLDNTFDAIFLDINMPVMSGLEVANKLREVNNNVSIIFVTNYASLAINGYGVDALGFIVKPVRKDDVKKIIEKVIAKEKDQINDKKIVIKVKSGYQTIRFSELKYLEIIIHDIYFYTTHGVYKSRGVLKEIEKEINSPNFAKCSNSCIVNMDYIDSVIKDDIKIDGKLIGISRNRKKDFLKSFLNRYH